jgi:hypothetical protein
MQSQSGCGYILYNIIEKSNGKTMDIEKIIKAAMPNATPGMINYIIWSKTPFPFREVTPKMLYSAAYRLYRAHKNNIFICELCDNKLQPDDNLFCEKCCGMLRRAENNLQNKPEDV